MPTDTPVLPNNFDPKDFVVITLADLFNSRKVNTEADLADNLDFGSELDNDDFCDDPACWCNDLADEEPVRYDEPEFIPCTETCGCENDCLGFDDDTGFDNIDIEARAKNLVDEVFEIVEEIESEELYEFGDEILTTATDALRQIAADQRVETADRIRAAESLITVWGGIFL